jgi:hypothetical protein
MGGDTLEYFRRQSGKQMVVIRGVTCLQEQDSGGWRVHVNSFFFGACVSLTAHERHFGSIQQ